MGKEYAIISNNYVQQYKIIQFDKYSIIWLFWKRIRNN